MNQLIPFPEDPRLLEIYELGARITTAETKDVRLWLWGNMRAKIDAYLREASVGENSKETA